MLFQHEIAKQIFVKEECTFHHYDDLKKRNFAGYAHYYIQIKWDDSSLENKAKLDVFKLLYRIDHRLGTTPELQLFYCCKYAVNIVIIEVIDNQLIIFYLFYF